MEDTFQIYRLEGAFAGIAGRVVLVQNVQEEEEGDAVQTVYVWRWAGEPNYPFDVGKPLRSEGVV